MDMYGLGFGLCPTKYTESDKFRLVKARAAVAELSFEACQVILYND